MPITEVPPTSPGTPPESGRRPRYSARYDGLDHSDLLHVIEDLQDDRAKARIREMVWISLLAHLFLFWFILYGPHYIFHRVLVRNPTAELLKHKKDMTYLDLPPDVLKQIRPKHAAPMSDKDRIAQSRKPTLDKKTLQELEAMRRAGPPVPQLPPGPKPAPRPQAAPQPQQQAQTQPPQPQPQKQQPPVQPLKPSQQSLLQAPKPAPTVPNFNTPTSARDAIKEAMKQAEQPGTYSGGGGGDMGRNAPTAHGGLNGAVDILSDTLGVDFGPYMQRVIYDTKRAWYPIIPEAAQPPLNKQGKVAIRFKILPDGSVKSMVLELPSGDVSLDRAAWGGITGAAPYPPLPKNFKGPFLELRFYFLYNIRPGDE